MEAMTSDNFFDNLKKLVEGTKIDKIGCNKMIGSLLAVAGCIIAAEAIDQEIVSPRWTQEALIRATDIVRRSMEDSLRDRKSTLKRR